jgi:Domain of unknown function (DUF5753)
MTGPWLIPDLLQTGDYARAIIGASPSAEIRIAMRIGRQELLMRRNPVQFHAVIREAALREPIADTEVIVHQLDHLARVAELPNVTVQVIPSNVTGWHPGLVGPFILLEFLKAKSIVHFEHHRASSFIFDDNDVTAYAELGRRLSELALTPGESVRLIGHVKEEIANAY